MCSSDGTPVASAHFANCDAGHVRTYHVVVQRPAIVCAMRRAHVRHEMDISGRRCGALEVCSVMGSVGDR